MDDLRTALGRTGIWAALDGIPADELLQFASLVEDLGFGTLWVNEGSGREPFAVLGALARTTSRITLGLGIATVYARDAAAAHAGARTIGDLSGGRFVMGIGASHKSSAEARGHEYARPLPLMRAYLDAYERAPWTGPATEDPPLVMAALGPGMLALAATRTAGAFPYLVTAGMVRDARVRLDAAARDAGIAATPLLIATLPAMLGDPAANADGARTVVGRYLGQPNYRANLIRGGFSEDDLNGPSDRLVRELVASGGRDDLRARVSAMHEAGADHVAVIPISAAGRQAERAVAETLAP